MQHMPPPLALEIRGLFKSFDRPAVNGLDLAVRTGEFYALLGPNGAGTTTTLRMIAGLLRAGAGLIRIAGIDALADSVAAKRLTAWISDEPMTYDKLTPQEYLEFVAGLWAVEPKLAEARARDLLDWLGLAPHARERCETFSKGMRQKVALAGALVHDPLLIILDEPLTGARCRLGAPGEERAARTRPRGRHDPDDHAHSGSRRAHGRSHRCHRARPAHRRRHARRLAPPRGQASRH